MCLNFHFFCWKSTKVTMTAFFFLLSSLDLTWHNSILQEDIRQLSRHIKSRQEARGLMCWGEAQMSVPALLCRSLYETLLDFCWFGQKVLCLQAALSALCAHWIRNLAQMISLEYHFVFWESHCDVAGLAASHWLHAEDMIKHVVFCCWVRKKLEIWWTTWNSLRLWGLQVCLLHVNEQPRSERNTSFLQTYFP